MEWARRPSKVALLVCVALCAGGSTCRRPNALVGCASPTADREAFLALIAVFGSVARDVTWFGRPLPNGNPANLALDDAVELLRCIPRAAALRAERQRYAVTKLAAAAVILQRMQRAQVAQRYVQQLQHLKVAAILLQRLSQAPADDVGDLESAAGDIIDDEPALQNFQRTCCPCIDKCTVGRATDETSGVSFKISVERSPREIACVVDPQEWPALVPAHFDEVFVVKEPACTTGDDPTCRGTTEPCPPAAQAPEESTNPPPPGTSWCGVIDEQFHAHVSNVESRLENLLKVRADVVPDDTSTQDVDETDATMNFDLCESISYHVGGENGECGVQKDCGYAKVRGSGIEGFSVFNGTKSVRFDQVSQYDLNGWAPIFLEALVKESALATCQADCGHGPAKSTEECKCPGLDICVQTADPYKPEESKYCP